MKKINVSEATNAQLDWLVATCWYADRRVSLTEGKTGTRVLRDPRMDGTQFSHWFVFSPTTDPSQMWPIIEREDIDLISVGVKNYRGRIEGGNPTSGYGPTRLIAVACCYIVSKLGATVEVPEELP